LPIAISAGYREAISSKSQLDWKIRDPRNPGIAEHFVERDTTGHKGTGVILMRLNAKF
jgi:hypothetical protein